MSGLFSLTVNAIKKKSAPMTNGLEDKVLGKPFTKRVIAKMFRFLSGPTDTAFNY